jgi:hypothetical protein
MMVPVTELEIRELGEVADLAAVARLFDAIWGGKPVSAELLRAMAVAGNYIAGAYEADKLLGACFGFLGETGLHSHIAGVASHGASATRSSSTSAGGRWTAACGRSPGRTIPWCGATPTST